MKKYLTVILTLCVQVFCHAWGNPGHMAVAKVAYDELTPAERAKIVAILRQHPDLSPINEAFGAGAPDDLSLFMAAATWPDLIRDDHNYADIGYEEDKPAVTAVDYHQLIKHTGWHFQDSYFWHDSAPAGPLPKTPAVNAVGVVNVLVAQINSAEDDAERAFDLMWLFHLVGDLHQPLHAVSAVNKHQPDGDHGGNWVHISGVPGETELHAYWDHLPGKTAPTDKDTHQKHLETDVQTAADFVANLKNVNLGAHADDLDPAVWATESFQIAKDDGYNFTPNGEGVDSKGHPFIKTKLPAGYDAQAMKDAQLRVKLAGHRLALILKQIAH